MSCKEATKLTRLAVECSRPPLLQPRCHSALRCWTPAEGEHKGGVIKRKWVMITSQALVSDPGLSLRILCWLLMKEHRTNKQDPFPLSQRSRYTMNQRGDLLIPPQVLMFWSSKESIDAELQQQGNKCLKRKRNTDLCHAQPPAPFHCPSNQQPVPE